MITDTQVIADNAPESIDKIPTIGSLPPGDIADRLEAMGDLESAEEIRLNLTSGGPQRLFGFGQAKAWQYTIDEIRRIIRNLPNNGPHLLHLLWKRIVPLDGPRTPEALAVAKLRLLVLKMSENWQQYALFLAESGVPTTNNATERAIGRWRTRSKTTRGFKSIAGLTAAFFICNGLFA